MLLEGKTPLNNTRLSVVHEFCGFIIPSAESPKNSNYPQANGY